MIHGTYAGAQQHRKDGTRVCDACKRASAVYVRRWRNRFRCSPGLGWPLAEVEHKPGVVTG